MPFQTNTIPPDPDPDVKILFHGLLLLTPNNGGCFVGVHKKSAHHKLIFVVNVKGQSQSIAWLEGKLKKPLEIKITGTPHGVTKYIKSGDPQDFDSSVDLHKLHPNNNLKLDAQYTRPGIYFNEGVLYAGRLTSANLQIVLKQNGKPDQTIGPLANPIAANIAFEERKLQLSWTDDGGNKTLTLPQLNTANEKYEILITNGENPVPPDPPQGVMKCGDFKEHYKVVGGVNANEEFDICFTSVKASAKAEARTNSSSLPDSTRVPCMAIVVDG